MISNVPHNESKKTNAEPRDSGESPENTVIPALPHHEQTTNRYTHGHEQAVLANHAQRQAVDCAAYLLPHVRPGMSVLDVGFGPGSITLDLAEIVAPGQVVGIENTDTPLRAAQDHAAARGDHHTKFIRADVMDMPFEDDSFDVVHAHQVIQHLADPVGALREMRRVCKPGGLIAVRDADYAAMSWYPELPNLEIWRTLYREIAHSNRAEPDAGRHLRRWAHAAGLTDLTVTTSNFTYSSAQQCRTWGESQARRVDGAAFRSQAAQLGYSDDDVTAIVESWRTWSSDPDAFFLIPNTEVLARVTKENAEKSQPEPLNNLKRSPNLTRLWSIGVSKPELTRSESTPETSTKTLPLSPASEQLRHISMQLTAISETGLWYGKDQFDIERFVKVGELAHQLMEHLAAHPLAEYDQKVASVAGYTTPKVDVRGAVFNEKGEILLVRETLDGGRWTLPGGWCDILESPRPATEREVLEEAGLKVKATHLAAVVDREKWPHHPPFDYHIYKLFYVCEPEGAVDPNYTSNETSEVGWFPVKNLPELSPSRVLPEQIWLAYEHWLHPGPAYSD